MIFYTCYRSPLGVLVLSGDGASLTGLWLYSQRQPPKDAVPADRLPLFQSVREWLDAYFRGSPREITFPLSPAGTEFQQAVRNCLLKIPYAQTATYGSIAREISPNMSAQAVGQALKNNPIPIIVPCHRVTGTNGTLTGFAWGLHYKEWLLRHEEETL